MPVICAFNFELLFLNKRFEVLLSARTADAFSMSDASHSLSFFQPLAVCTRPCTFVISRVRVRDWLTMLTLCLPPDRSFSRLYLEMQKDIELVILELCRLT